MNTRTFLALLLITTLLSPALAQARRDNDQRGNDQRRNNQRGNDPRDNNRRDDARRSDNQRNDDSRERRVHTRGSVTFGRSSARDQSRGRDNVREPVREPEHRDRWGHHIEFGANFDRDRANKIEIEINRRHPREVRPVPYGTCVVKLPHGARTVICGGITYYEADGIFFTVGTRPRTYVVVRPPVGVVVSAIPSDYQVVVVQDQPYYVYDDTYFDMDLHVVNVPVGGCVDTLPARHEVTVIGGNKYFSFSGGFFKPLLRDGRTLYLRVEVHR